MISHWVPDTDYSLRSFDVDLSGQNLSDASSHFLRYCEHERELCRIQIQLGNRTGDLLSETLTFLELEIDA